MRYMVSRMITTGKYTICTLLLIMICLGSTATAQIVVVVNDSNSISDLTLDELRRIYLGKTTAFPNGKEIVLMEYAHLCEKFYKAVLNMTELKVRKHWIKVVFSGEYATPPIEYHDPDEIKNLVCKKRGAICFVRLSDLEDCMKVLTIGGKEPDDEGYPLR